MPTDVWRNLRTERRDRVLVAAMTEFGARGFSAGSLNVIAREAKVAKGSIFQYFDGKLDLFATVGDVTSRRIRDHMEARMALIPPRPFFDFLAVAADEWVAYFADHPLERGVTAATNLEIDPAVRDIVRRVAHGHYLAVLRPLVHSAADDGELRTGADPEALLALLLLVVPHLALAPHLPGLDPILGMYGKGPAELHEPVRQLIGSLRAAFGPDRVPAGAGHGEPR